VRDVPRSTSWFGGDEPRTEDEARFLAVLRAHDEAWRSAGVEPSGTTVLTGLVPLHVQVDLPGLPADRVNLQVAFWTTGPRGTGVEGQWGDDHLLDGGTAGGMEVFGLPADPEELAGFAVRWLTRALAAPVDRADWVGRDGEVVASRWVLAESGAVVGSRGTPPRSRLRPRPADRVLRAR
jgi:hypothetical protein